MFAGGTVTPAGAALRPAISNRRTTASDLDLLMEVVPELGARRDPGQVTGNRPRAGRGHHSWPVGVSYLRPCQKPLSSQVPGLGALVVGAAPTGMTKLTTTRTGWSVSLRPMWTLPSPGSTNACPGP